MKSVYLTFDMETIVSRLSFGPNIYTNVILGTLYIAKELKKRNLKGTFYISFSPKTDLIDYETYIENIHFLIDVLKPFENIKIQPHIHAKSLPMSFSTQSDAFSSYGEDEQIELLKFGKEFLENHGIEVDSFRPGSYKNNDQYYKSLNASGYKFSTLLIKDVNIDLIEKKVLKCKKPYKHESGIIEYPVTAVKVKSKTGKIKVENLSPDFFTIESVKFAFEELEYINVNFHSFSMFTNRFGRENHAGLFSNNIKYAFLEKPLNKFLRMFNMEIINKKTLFREELINWLDYIEDNKDLETKFIGE